MLVTIRLPMEIEITHVKMTLPVRYEEEDIPNDFPLRSGDTWAATVNIDTGQIEGWPLGQIGHLQMKVSDGGTYQLLGSDGKGLARIGGGFVPNGVIPGNYGTGTSFLGIHRFADYVDLQIDKTGRITNWPKQPDVTAFFNKENE